MSRQWFSVRFLPDGPNSLWMPPGFRDFRSAEALLVTLAGAFPPGVEVPPHAVLACLQGGMFGPRGRELALRLGSWMRGFRGIQHRRPPMVSGNAVIAAAHALSRNAEEWPADPQVQKVMTLAWMYCRHLMSDAVTWDDE